MQLQGVQNVQIGLNQKHLQEGEHLAQYKYVDKRHENPEFYL